MNKTVKWILIGLGILIVLLLVGKMLSGSSNEGIKVTAEKAQKRTIIETVNDQLKNISNIEHTRHRSLWNFLGNVAAGLIAYSWKEKKPSLNIKQTVPAIVC